MALTQEKIEEIKKQLEGLGPEEQQAKLQEILQTLPQEDREQLMGGGGEGKGGGGGCPFCAMSEGKIPVTKVYEDSEFLAIIDINPATSGHTLLFPKNHASDINELSEEDTGKLFKLANRIAKSMTKGINAAGVNIYLASGQAAGQTAPHLLVNIIPRFENDGVRFGWQPKKLSEEEMQTLSKNISNNLGSEKKVAVSDDDLETIEEDDPVWG